MNTANLNYETKIFAPTKELYQQLSQQANELLEHALISTNDMHTKIAEASMELYNHPSETTSRWKAELTEKSNELYSFVNTDVIPAAKADYQHLLNTATDYSTQVRGTVQFFIDHPKLVTAEAFNALNQGLIQFFNASINVSAQALENISTQANDIVEFLTMDPLQGIENLYYDSLSFLLNSYFDMVSSLLLSANF